MSGLDFKRLFEVSGLNAVENPHTGRKYDLVRFLGQGAFGTVFLGVDPVTNQEYAVKFINLTTDEDLEYFNEETSSYLYLSTEPKCQSTIVCLFDSFIITQLYGERVGVLVTELMDGDLEQLPPSQQEIVPMLRSILEGLYFIHQRGLAHRDIKPGNVLRKGDIFKIGDLGLLCANAYSDIPTCSVAGTPWYISPAAHNKFDSNTSLEFEQAEDIWALGIMLMELLFGYGVIYSSENDIRYMTQSKMDRIIDSVDFSLLDPVDINAGQLKELIKNMLVLDYRLRWTAPELLDELNEDIHLNTITLEDQPISHAGVHSQDLYRLIESAVYDPQHATEHLTVAQCILEGGDIDFECIKNIADMYRQYHQHYNIVEDVKLQPLEDVMNYLDQISASY